MPARPLAHICLLVEDLDVATEDWRQILSVLDPDQVSQPEVRYDDFTGGNDAMRWVTFIAEGATEIQLCEPAPDTPLGRRLAKHGEHVHHICFTTPDVKGSVRRLASKGLEVDVDNTYGDPDLPWQEWTWVFPKSAHGVLVEIARPYKAEGQKWVSAE